MILFLLTKLFSRAVLATPARYYTRIAMSTQRNVLYSSIRVTRALSYDRAHGPQIEGTISSLIVIIYNKLMVCAGSNNEINNHSFAAIMLCSIN